MASTNTYDKSGLVIQCSAIQNPAPRPQVAWPIPSIQTAGALPALLTLSLVELSSGATPSAILVTSAPLPMASDNAATWTLYVQQYQGTPGSLPAAAPIPLAASNIVAGAIQYTFTNPMPDATVNMWLESVDGNVTTTYPAVTISTTPDPGPVAVPVILDVPALASVSGNPEILIACAGAGWGSSQGNAYWGGADVWISLDGGASYVFEGTINGPCHYGSLMSNLTSTAVGTVAQFDFTLSNDSTSLQSVTTTTAQDGATPVWINGEVVDYSTISLAGTSFQYNATLAVRGAYGTTAATQSAGAPVVALDGVPFRWQVPNSLLGVPIYVKLVSANLWGFNGNQTLANTTAYAHTPAGAGTSGGDYMNPISLVPNFNSQYGPVSGIAGVGVLNTAGLAFPGYAGSPYVRAQKALPSGWNAITNPIPCQAGDVFNYNAQTTCTVSNSSPWPYVLQLEFYGASGTDLGSGTLASGLVSLHTGAVPYGGWVAGTWYWDSYQATAPANAAYCVCSLYGLGGAGSSDFWVSDIILTKHAYVASSSVLGPVKVGNGLTVAGDGTVSTTIQALLASTAPGQGDSLVSVLQPFPTAIARTQHLKNADTVTTLDFGAIGDGASHPLSGVTLLGTANTTGWTLGQWQALWPHVTSLTNELDWCAWQAALNAALLVSGVGPEKSYKINMQLNLRTGHNVDTAGCTITQTAMQTPIFNHFGQSNITIWGGGNLIGVGASDYLAQDPAYSVGIYGDGGGSNIQVYGITLNGFAYAGVRFAGHTDCIVARCTIVGPVLPPVTTYQCYGVVLDQYLSGTHNACQRVAISECSISQVAVAVRAEGTSDTVSNKIRIHANACFNLYQTAFYIGAAVSDALIDFNSVGNAALDGMKIQPDILSPYLADMWNISVIGNTFVFCGNMGVNVQNGSLPGSAVFGTNPFTRNLVIMGNTVRFAAGSGISVTDAHGVVIESNTVDSCGFNGVALGNSWQVTIDTNHVRNCGNCGIAALTANTGVKVRGNDVNDCSAGLTKTSTFSGTISGSVLTLTTNAVSGYVGSNAFILGGTLSGLAFTSCTVNTRASGVLGNAGSTYNLSASPGNVALPEAMTLTVPVSTFSGTISGSVLTLVGAATGGFALGRTLFGWGFTNCLINTLASGSLGAAGSTYNLSASPGNVSVSQPMAVSIATAVSAAPYGIFFQNGTDISVDENYVNDAFARMTYGLFLVSANNNTFSVTRNRILAATSYAFQGLGVAMREWADNTLVGTAGPSFNNWPIAPSVASVAALVLPSTVGKGVTVTGTTNITSIGAGGHFDHEVKLLFTGILTMTSVNNLKLTASFTSAAGSLLSLYCDGTNWTETGRKV